MAKILVVVTHATDDPTRTTLAFITVMGALETGKEVVIVLLGEAAHLAKEAVVKSIHGVGFPPLSEFVEKAVNGNVPVYV
jgi:predicted peroxiredoxin